MIMVRQTYHLLNLNKIDQLWKIPCMVWLEIQTCLWTAVFSINIFHGMSLCFIFILCKINIFLYDIINIILYN